MKNILQDLVSRYANGEALSTLEKESGFYRLKIIRAIKKAKIPLHGSLAFSKDVEKQIATEYAQGNKTKFLSKKYSVSPPCIREIAKRNGCTIRPNNVECRIYFPDEDYFNKIDREEKAYILGLLYADGCNTGKRVIISLTGIDEKALLVKIGELLYPFDKRFHISLYKRAWSLKVVNKKIAEVLIRQGVVPRKSLILSFPSADIIGDNLLPHFIRGYFDGDGSIFWTKGKYNQYAHISIIGTHAFLLGIQGFLSKHGIVSHLNDTSASKGKVFDLRFSSKNSIDKFYSLIYTAATIWLSRKRDAFEKK